jgi:predicted TPR repeat methyltransferase
MEGPLQLASALKDFALDSTARDAAKVERLFASSPDPFHFANEPQRFERATQLLDSVGRRFRRGLEIGCAEALFTSELAARCDELLAVDISPTALRRAEERCHELRNVRFALWDLRSDPVPGSFDLVVATGVLEYICRPATLRAVCDRLIDALEPNGCFLVGNTVAACEESGRWWARPLLRGTTINTALAGDPRLQAEGDSLDQCIRPFRHTLFRKSDTRTAQPKSLATAGVSA